MNCETRNSLRNMFLVAIIMLISIPDSSCWITSKSNHISMKASKASKLCMSTDIIQEGDNKRNTNWMASLLASLLILPMSTPPAFAVDLGMHSGCAYPACTSQLEILQSAAPGLVSNEAKLEQIQILKDIKFVLGEFTQFSENKDYASIRSGLRSSPGGSLRLTARKLRNYIEQTNLGKYNDMYNKMIEAVDDVDIQANLRIRKESNDDNLKKAIDKAIKQYSLFLTSIDEVVELSAPVKADFSVTPPLVG